MAERALAVRDRKAIAQGMITEAIPAPPPPTPYTLTYDQLRLLDALVTSWNERRAKTRKEAPLAANLIKDATHAEVIDLILQWELERE